MSSRNSWFDDHSGYRDFMSFVTSYAPDFPKEDYLTDEEQLDLESAFEVLRLGLDSVRPPLSPAERDAVLTVLRTAETAFRRGDDRTGALALNELEPRLFQSPRTLLESPSELPNEDSVFFTAFARVEGDDAAYCARMKTLASPGAYVDALARLGWVDGWDQAEVAVLATKVRAEWGARGARAYRGLAELPPLVDGFDGTDEYEELILSLGAISRGRFSPSAVAVQSEIEHGVAWFEVSFQSAGSTYATRFIQYDSFFRVEVANLLGRALADAGVVERLIDLPTDLRAPSGEQESGMCFAKPGVFLAAVHDHLIPAAMALVAELPAST